MMVKQMLKKNRSTANGVRGGKAATRGRVQRSIRYGRSGSALTGAQLLNPDQRRSSSLYLLASLFETSPDANLLIDESGRIVAANRAAESLFGYTQAELTGMAVDQLVPDSRRAEHGQQRQNYFANPQPRGMAEAKAARLELYARAKEGQVFPVEITLNPARTSLGWVIHCVVRNARQRLHHTQEMQTQTGLVRLLQEVAIAANEARATRDAFVYALDRICAFLHWPFGHAALIDVESGGSAQQHFWSSQIPDQFNHFRAATEALQYVPGLGLNGQVMLTGQPAWYSHLGDHPQFRRKHDALQASLRTGMALPILVDKTVVGVLEFFHTQDLPANPNLLAILPHISLQLGRVVERERSERALRKNAAQMRMVIANLPVLLWLVDREGRLVMLEGKAVENLDIQTDTLLGQNMFHVLEPDPESLNHLRRALGGEEVHTEIKTSAGSTFELFYTPSYDPNGQVEAAIGLALDVSQRKRIENELEEVKHSLLDNIDTDRARLAHQLHDGPLQDLYGAFYQIQEIKAGLDGGQQETANRALQTIQAVNATLRVICGELHPDTLVHLGLPKAIRAHTDRILERQQQARIVLELDDGKDTLPHATRLGIYRIFQQLVSNAAQHADARNIWVRLHFPPGEVLLEVQDDGKGFEIPQRWVDLVRKGQLGLVSTVERVHGMDGSIEIHSRPDLGTTVKVKIPVKI